jgi:hypothetical protein
MNQHAEQRERGDDAIPSSPVMPTSQHVPSMGSLSIFSRCGRVSRGFTLSACASKPLCWTHAR